ncbi:NAD(P)/FAD-dependent oxidoreductase [Persicimonas caeni]|uniref:NAD(P)/FAD-dependent oxidoreductase n=1 Tax=Persicimonas caeni TaxID=2292766 RepID=A0A4Y6PN23_PERCE|nr:FAD/NAD(P)-binding oxidoreductase [Persicimonas caeni]QDG49613.1 NAD(P)/FAD-dependent oxidoreductase [Persicimonas caeni]QED30834.1 NAD(P)/FAD-dependent oxidoreductase [Persicimonas caeni]
MHFVIIGNGVAGIEAAFAIRDRLGPGEAKITVISDETDYFFSRTALMYAYMDKLDRRDLEPYERKVYAQKQIELVRGRVVDLDAAEASLRLQDGSTVAYDRLLLAVGAKPRMVPFAGLDEVEEGLVHFVSMQDLDECERLTWSTERAVVVGGGLIGVELVESLTHHGVEVTFLVREPWFWPAALGKEEAEIVAEHIREHGVDLRMEEEMSEIQVDDAGRVSGVRTNLGDEIPCQMLGVAIGVQANVEWLQGVSTPPAINRGVMVDRSFRTTLPNVWAAGDCVEVDVGRRPGLVETIWYSAKRHGKLAGLSMAGERVEYHPPLFYNSTKFFELEFTTVGDCVDVADGATTLFRKMPGKPISQRIVANERGEVIGFNMLGSRFDHRVLEQWIHDRRDLAWVQRHLQEAQFDVEFGRVPLSKMVEKEIA